MPPQRGDVDDKSTDYESQRSSAIDVDYSLQRGNRAMSATLNTITYGLALFVVGWHVVAFVVGGAMIAWEHFTRPPEPTPEEISAEADAYEARYGEAAFRQIGNDMYAERTAIGSGRRYRFLRSVSGELIARMLQRQGRSPATSGGRRKRARRA